MNKSEFRDAVVARVKTDDIASKAAADRIVAAVFDVIKDTVVSGEDVSIVGFGTFTTVDRAAKVGVNPSTHEKMDIPAKSVPKFNASKAFKDAVNNK